jgi:hypothetical protein
MNMVEISNWEARFHNSVYVYFRLIEKSSYVVVLFNLVIATLLPAMNCSSIPLNDYEVCI